MTVFVRFPLQSKENCWWYGQYRKWAILICQWYLCFCRCSSNCERKVSVNRRFILTTTCTGFQCHRIVKHNWKLFQLKAIERNGWIEIPNFKDSILTDIDSPNLVIPGRILEEKRVYKIRAIVILENGFQISETRIFVTNFPPAVTTEIGGCSITPREGFAVITEFNISCSGWNDTDRPLSYEFRFVIHNIYVTGQNYF